MKRCISWISVLVLVCVGCGPKFGQVSGVVTYHDKPLPGGTITFRPADPAQNSVAYVLETDGKFRVTLPAGEVAVCIDNREFEPLPPTIPPNFDVLNQSKLSEAQKSAIQAAAVTASQQETARASARYVKIPDKYYAIETSGLAITVNEGEQTTPIELKD